jgi:hypothetical protein
MDRMHCQLEIAGSTATVYVAGVLDRDSAQGLIAACGTIPLSVRTLRLDLRALGAMTAEATNAVRIVFRRWCHSRCGDFQLNAAHLVAVCRDLAPLQPGSRHRWVGRSVGATFIVA